MAGVVTTKLLEALAEIGVDVSKKQPSNVKTLATKNKSTATKPGLLVGERDTGGNFGTVLDIFKREAQYIDGMDDVQQMAFLNNIMDYKEFGGKSINKTSEGITGLEKNLEDIQSTAKTMKDDAEAGLASAEKDLKDFLDTGGQPLKAKSDKYLGGSMHEEGQLRTAIRQFLQNEYKNGRIKLDKDDQFRVMEYSPMLEDDPIKVFKKIYGDEAYTKAGTFPGAFEIGENFKHYEEIFRNNMGEDILKVKDKKYVGDGKLVLTKQEEVFEPTPDDDDVPFAKGGRASFVGGKIVDELVAMIIKKEPMDAMKEVNKIIGKKGKYKNLTQKDIDRIVDQTNDHIFQRDPDNLYVGDRKIKRYDEEGEAQFNKDVEEAGGMEKFLENNPIGNTADDMSLEDSLTRLEGLGATKMAERFRLKQKYPGLDDDLLTNIIEDTDPVHKASVLAKIDMAMELGKTNKSAEEIIDILKKEPETKMATGGRAGYSDGNIVYEGEGPIQFDLPFGEPMFTMKMNGKLFGIYKNKNGSHLSVPLGSDGKPNYAKGGRAGYYMGGQATVEPDLSDIGHGSDSLMARTRITAPGSQATTSTGLNYLLGEDNDNIRVPFNEGLLAKPSDSMMVDTTTSSPDFYNTDKFKEDSMTLLKGMYGTGKDSNQFLYNEMIKKGNELRKQGVDRETVIKIIRTNKNKIDEILRQQEFKDIRPKSLAGLANGGRIGFAGGGADMSTVADSKGNVGAKSVNVSPSGSVTTSKTRGPDGPDDRGSPQQNLNHLVAMHKYQNPQPQESKLKNVANTAQEINYLNNLYKMNIPGLAIGYGINRFGPSIMEKLKNLRSEAEIEDFEDNNYFLAAEGGIAGLRQGYAGGTLVDKGRRGFLKFLGGTAAGVVALKAGLVKLLGKDSGAISKKAIDEVIIDGGSGAPAWLQPLVNKALKEGKDISKNAIVDGQVVKTLDTPTGKVDVYYNVRTGEVDVDYIGGNTALGESVQLRYTPGIADEGTKGVKPADEFEATEAIPEYQGGNPLDGPSLEVGENITSDVKGLYSDTSELAELGGEKLLIKDISDSIKKKKVLKKMEDQPADFITDEVGIYDPT
jgi:hypothetical protein